MIGTEAASPELSVVLPIEATALSQSDSVANSNCSLASSASHFQPKGDCIKLGATPEPPPPLPDPPEGMSSKRDKMPVIHLNIDQWGPAVEALVTGGDHDMYMFCEHRMLCFR